MSEPFLAFTMDDWHVDGKVNLGGKVGAVDVTREVDGMVRLAKDGKLVGFLSRDDLVFMLKVQQGDPAKEPKECSSCEGVTGVNDCPLCGGDGYVEA